jgi:excisionase family DNA binding protein
MTTHSTQVPPDPERDVLRYAEAGSLLAIPVATLYSMVHEHTIPHYRVGPRTVLFRRSELLAWLKRHEVAATPTTGRR